METYGEWKRMNGTEKKKNFASEFMNEIWAVDGIVRESGKLTFMVRREKMMAGEEQKGIKMIFRLFKVHCWETRESCRCHKQTEKFFFRFIFLSLFAPSFIRCCKKSHGARGERRDKKSKRMWIFGLLWDSQQQPSTARSAPKKREAKNWKFLKCVLHCFPTSQT